MFLCKHINYRENHVNLSDSIALSTSRKYFHETKARNTEGPSLASVRLSINLLYYFSNELTTLLLIAS